MKVRTPSLVKLVQSGIDLLKKFSTILHSEAHLLSRTSLHSSIRFTGELLSLHNRSAASQKNDSVSLLHNEALTKDDKLYTEYRLMIAE